MSYETIESYTFESILEQALSNVPDTLDKRQGSIIYDALAPACLALSELYMQLRDILISTYAETSYGQFLDLRVQERGLTRYPASKAVRTGVFTDSENNAMSIPIGARFSTINGENSVNFTVVGVYVEDGQVVAGSYELECEESGIVGNNYVGALLPLDNIQGLVTATLSTILTPAQNEETDEELRSRYMNHLMNQSFGGNVTQYNDILKGMSGISEVQVYPTWNGGGTVKCSIIDGSYKAVSSEFIEDVQELIDPTDSQGDGMGLAPIGHTVTVVTPTELDIDISATIVLVSGYTVSQLKPEIEVVLGKYLLELRHSWGTESSLNHYELSVFKSKIISAILTVTGVANVTNVQINGQDADLSLTETATTQQLPILGEVVLNE